MFDETPEYKLTEEEKDEIREQEAEAERIAVQAAEDAEVDKLIEESNKERPIVAKGKSEELPSDLKFIKNKNGFFIETLGTGWIKLTKGQVLKLAELIVD